MKTLRKTTGVRCLSPFFNLHKGTASVTNGHIGRTRTFRLLGRTTAVSLMLLLTGCAAASGPLPGLAPLGGPLHDQSLRKQVEADSFPAAQKAGL